ncbi:hypothetical protein [Phenylobacterium sp.]|uniref:hypothetical protein n=1 Tax=Phenylobacterium sp. TaxID=1871053 RepID=UPI002732E63D|nr:hypothetical protein [Phenylobacterium sp.]MDP3852702.1 hypothetical protein [Phenylobacterium sp.]
MTAILYPVAANAEQALAAPLARASREREAAALAGEPVSFVSEAAGPRFATREAALDAYAGRLEDERPGRTASLPPEDRFLRLAQTVAKPRLPPAVAPTYQDGRRWPAPKTPPPPTVWRLMVSYWRIGAVVASRPETPQARQARRRGRQSLDSEAVRALVQQPLQAVKPQQPLDIGLFETRLPESPHIIVPDE